MEEKQVVISRLGGTVVFPADFMLVMATNPCRCGYYPDPQHCRCTQSEVDRYFGKIRGPVLDRIDICVATSKLEIRELSGGEGMDSAAMRESIRKAQEIQLHRFQNQWIRFNSQMTRKDMEKFCSIRDTDRKILDQAYYKYNMSARGYYKVLKVARTIADLAGEEQICREHIIEAIGYRNTFCN